MYHKVRIVVISLVVVAISVLSSTGTLSYFTDTEIATNNFAIGNASTLMKIYDNDVIVDDEHIFSDDGRILVDNTDVEFYPQATNDGNISIYQRFRVVIPIALKGVITLNLPNMDNGCTITATDAVAATEKTCSNSDYTVTYKPAVKVEDVDTYAEYYVVSNNPLAVGDSTTMWPMFGIHIGDLSESGYTLDMCTEDRNNCMFGVNVYSDAIQTAGFTNGAVSAFVNFPEIYN